MFYVDSSSLYPQCRVLLFCLFLFFFRFFFPFIFISWKIITLQYCSGFCHTLTWISHGFTCVPHPIPLGLPSAPAPSTCLMHPIWAGDLSYPWQYTCFNAILSEHLNTQGPSYIYLVPKKKKCFQIHDFHTQIHHKLPKKKSWKMTAREKWHITYMSIFLFSGSLRYVW